MTTIPSHQIDSLKENPLVEAVYIGKIISAQSLECLYDLDTNEYKPLVMEPNDEVLVTKLTNGTYYMHFMSLTPNRFHYRAPWVFDDQVTINEESL
jgi:hypothetical protein